MNFIKLIQEKKKLFIRMEDIMIIGMRNFNKKLFIC